jgi:hypothetical protein
MDVMPAVAMQMTMRTLRPIGGLGTRLLARTSATRSSSSCPHLGSRSGNASPSRRYRTALSRRDVLLLAAPPFVIALSPAFEVDLVWVYTKNENGFHFAPMYRVILE